MRIKSFPIRSLGSDFESLPDIGSNYCAVDLDLNNLPSPNSNSNTLELDEDFPDPDLPPSSSSSSSTSISPPPIPTDDLSDIDDAILFISIAIQCEGSSSNSLPSQKTLQKLGLHTSRQRRAREFLRRTGILRGNLRTYLTDGFTNLGTVADCLSSLRGGVPGG